MVRQKGLDTLWCRRRRAAAERMSAGHLHFYGSSPKNKNNPNPSPAEIRFGLFCFGTPEGTRYIMVSASSSRRRANVHRTFAFYGSSPRYKNNPNPSPTEIRFGLFCFGTPEGTRTPNPRNRNPMLYPLSHRRIFQSQIIIAGFAGFVKRKTKFFSEHMVEYGGKRLFFLFFCGIIQKNP